MGAPWRLSTPLARRSPIAALAANVLNEQFGIGVTAFSIIEVCKSAKGLSDIEVIVTKQFFSDIQ
jgi:hypothetical protein